MSVDITFGVLNYNPDNNADAEWALNSCLSSFAASKSKYSHEVYVIDQGSTLHSQQKLVTTYANELGWRSILLEKNVGISRGINMLARIARGQYICLITSDVIFTPGLDAILIDSLKSNPNLWQVCPASDNSELAHQRSQYQKSGLAYTLAAQELTVQMWPRKVFETIGYFDERWKACFENMDFALRIFLAGGNVAVNHDAYCPHKHAMSVKSGARNKTYDGYIHMPNGFNQEILHGMWNAKWPGLSWSSLYAPPPNELERTRLRGLYHKNIYLDYVQNVGY